MAVGNKTKNADISFDLNGHTIKSEPEVKLLGVTFDFQLKFTSHVSNICKKSSRQLNVLKRMGKHLCKLSKLTIYHSFIMSNFNFCPLVWHFCGETNTKKIEKIQERALRFIYNDFENSYDTLLIKSKLPSLKIRRMRSIALETFNILNKNGPSYLHDLVTKKHSNYYFRYTNLVHVPPVRTTRYGLNSFRYASANIWNKLPEHMRQEQTLHSFRNMLSTWDGTDRCKCMSCNGP